MLSDPDAAEAPMDRLLDFFNESSAGVRAVASTAFLGRA